jgi:hypothetical protein
VGSILLGPHKPEEIVEDESSKIFDPGGSGIRTAADVAGHYRESLLWVLHTKLPRSVHRSAVVRTAMVGNGGPVTRVTKLLLDTGASSGSYIGEDGVQRIDETNRASGRNAVRRHPCRQRARLGDGKTVLEVSEMVYLQVGLLDDYGEPLEPIFTPMYIVPGLGDQIIIGLEEILGNYYDYFEHVLRQHRKKSVATRDTTQLYGELIQLYAKADSEISKRSPRSATLLRMASSARRTGAKYNYWKSLIMADSDHSEVEQTEDGGSTTSFLVSSLHGVAYSDDRVETLSSELAALCENPILALGLGDLAEPWSHTPEGPCEEELITPDPLSFGEDILHFMETGQDEAVKEYLASLPEHVSQGMQDACQGENGVMSLLQSAQAKRVFVPEEWLGMRVPAATFTLKGAVPDRLYNRPRPVRTALYDAAYLEFERLKKYFYTDSESAIASPLVIAPKATYPFIRFCGDYRRINEFIEIPQQPIPIVAHELTKAAKFRYYVDLDMANSFHQIPLSREFSELLSVVTPWGLVRPKFLPEGVGPASGLLQHLVRDIFKDFADWTIVIFDNFLILADSYEDAQMKLEKIIQRCDEFRIVLKMKKSFIGVETVTFFGYEVTHGKWKLSQTRKDAISALQMPRSSKEMQSFLGAALFFHHHVPDYSEWAACLYEMTHADFSWDPGGWTQDYVAHFERFKVAIAKASELHFPDYSLPWVIRCDASQYAVGAVLFQEATIGGEIVHQPIAFSSKRFSGPASNWDTYKREAFAIYHAVDSFSYYLRGKDFLVETDHRNLQWIESSESPIVIRWRALLQSFPFIVRHIPGRENKVADWISRMGAPVTLAALLFAIGTVDQPASVPSPAFEQIMQEVHGGRRLHFGAAETWRRAKAAYPVASIRLQAVQEWVRGCALCQKMRDTGVEGLPAQTLSLKPECYRRRVGVDHVTVTPADKYGNTCVILVVEHYSHFPHAHAAKDYSAETVAIALFKHFCTFGVFDEIASDPGSAFMSDVVKELNRWLGIKHKVSLVGRHESNGCEGSGKQFLRHLTTLVCDERLQSEWSSDTVLPLINFHLAAFPTSETGGLTPFQLKYGTQDASFFKLPDELPPGQQMSDVLRLLDANLKIVRAKSLEFQQALAAERRSKDGPPQSYEPGDLVLWNPRESPSDFLNVKLSPNWLGPFEVVQQMKNDVQCKHLVLRTVAVLHVSRLKPFLGSREEAYRVAKLDHNQYEIVSVDSFTGNPHLRSTMTFTVTFEDGTITMPYGADLAGSAQFEAFVQSRPELFPLRFTAARAKEEIRKINRLAIASVVPGDTVFVNLRYFDDMNSTWFDDLHLPESAKTYVAECCFTRWSSNRRKIFGRFPVFPDTEHCFTTYEVQAFGSIRDFEQSSSSTVLVKGSSQAQYPQIWAAV